MKAAYCFLAQYVGASRWDFGTGATLSNASDLQWEPQINYHEVQPILQLDDPPSPTIRTFRNQGATSVADPTRAKPIFSGAGPVMSNGPMTVWRPGRKRG